MARIPEGELERLKAEVSLERLAESQGIRLAVHGADRIGLCPFHDDKEPSLVITPTKNLWYCLGACQAGGSVIDWVMRAEGVSFRHAVELLQADYQPSAVPAAKRSTVQKAPTALEGAAEDARLLLQVVDYYHETLLGSPEAVGLSREAGDRIAGGCRSLQSGLREPDARVPAAGEEPQGGSGHPRAAAADRDSPVLGP